MSWLSRWFGQCGTVRWEFTCEDNRTGTAKSYIETFGMDNDELKRRLKQLTVVETGVPVKSINIIAFAEHTQ